MSEDSKGLVFFPIAIPTGHEFLEQWRKWTIGKVGREFKRSKERIPDTVQTVFVRLLTKQFIYRWFFKHLTDELVDIQQARQVLGGLPIQFIGALPPAVRRPRLGKQSSTERSLWRVRDLLDYAKFDYDRYFYSAQNHTIDTPRFLRLLGYPETQYSALASLWRQGRLRPAELTEHECRGGKCAECDAGRRSLRLKGISLADDWMNPAVEPAIRKLRWNDSQLKPFLRQWRRQNIVSCPPSYIMRESPRLGIDAGLLKYAEIIVKNEVTNDFKRMRRSDDLPKLMLDGRPGHEFATSELVSYDADEDDGPSIADFKDTSSERDVADSDMRHDIDVIVGDASLSDEESRVVHLSVVDEMSATEIAKEMRIPLARVNRAKAFGMEKLRSAGRAFVSDEPEAVYGEFGFGRAPRADRPGPSPFENSSPDMSAEEDLSSPMHDDEDLWEYTYPEPEFELDGETA